MTSLLTPREKETARTTALTVMRQRLEQRKPDPDQYLTGESQAARWITATLAWSKAFVPLIALLAALASAVRTVQTASEIYTASGSNPLAVALAAIAFAVSVEGALFVLALAQESNPDEKGLGKVIAIAFTFAIASNAYLGLRPLLSEVGSKTLQGFVADLLSAPARVQMTFIVDLVAVLFPPLMALKAGHLTAHFAAEIVGSQVQARQAYAADLETWRAGYADPLATEEGQALLQEMLTHREQAKVEQKAKRRPISPPVDLEVLLPVAAAPKNGNGNGYHSS